MQLLNPQEFREQTAKWNMHWDRDCGIHRFGNGEFESPWPWPKADGFTPRWELAKFIIDALEASALGESGGFYLYPLHGHWNHGHEREFYWRYYRIRDAILTSIGIPTNFEGAAFFSHTEQDQLAAAIFARCFMIDDRVGSSADDSWVYPGHGQIYLHFDDEEITWAMAAHKEPLHAFDKELGRLGWGWLRDKERNKWDWPLMFLTDPGPADRPGG